MTEEEQVTFRTSNKMVEDAVIQKDEDHQLSAAIITLPIEYREVIYLFYYEELLIKEIAVLTKVSVNTMRTNLKSMF